MSVKDARQGPRTENRVLCCVRRGQGLCVREGIGRGFKGGLCGGGGVDRGWLSKCDEGRTCCSCVGGKQPRKFKQTEVAMLANMSEMAVREIEASHVAARIRRQEALLLRAVDALTMPFLIVDTSKPKWDVSYVNGAACELVGGRPLRSGALLRCEGFGSHDLSRVGGCVCLMEELVQGSCGLWGQEDSGVCACSRKARVALWGCMCAGCTSVIWTVSEERGVWHARGATQHNDAESALGLFPATTALLGRLLPGESPISLACLRG